MNTSVARAAPADPTGDRVGAVLFFILVITGGQVLLPLLLATFAFSKNTTRHPTLALFLLSGVLYSLSICLLLYTGHENDDDPPQWLCFTQISMVNGVFVMAAFASATLVLHLRLTMPAEGKAPRQLGWQACAALLIVPPSSLVFYQTLLFVVYTARPELVAVERRNLVCRFQVTPTTMVARKAPAALIGAAVVLTVGVSVQMVQRTARRLLDARGQRALLESPSGAWFRILVRFTMFSVYSLLTTIVCVVTVAQSEDKFHGLVDIFVGTLPLAAFVIFGTLPDVLRVWCFWRRQPMRASSVAEANAVFSRGFIQETLPAEEEAKHHSRSE